MTTLNNVKRAFNKAKSSYDSHSGLQKHIGDQLIQYLLAVFHKQSRPRIIDLGCGTGTTTQQLIDNIPFSELHAIDIADDLLEITKAKLNGTHIHVYHRAFDQLREEDGVFDIAFSNMSLHWSDHFTATLRGLHTHLNKHGLIAFSVPLPGTLQELQPHFTVNEFTDATSISKHLIKLGFDVLAEQNETITLRFADTLSALRSIKQVGANATKSKQSNRLSGKSLTHKVNISQLTYKIGYFVARKMEHPCQSNYSLPAQTQTAAKPILA